MLLIIAYSEIKSNERENEAAALRILFRKYFYFQKFCDTIADRVGLGVPVRQIKRIRRQKDETYQNIKYETITEHTEKGWMR